MAIFNLYSKRQRAIKNKSKDVYIYDDIPQTLRVQIVQIIRDALGTGYYGSSDRPGDAYAFINKSLCHEYGVFYLNSKWEGNPPEYMVLNFLLSEMEIDRVLDIIEFTFSYIETVIKPDYFQYSRNTNNIHLKPDEAFDELNYRFRESSIGYQYEVGKIFRIDSTFTHAEITKPTLLLLNNRKFKGANEEYIKAHEHYRHGRNKECLTECLKAFESTMKIICKEKGWAFNQQDTSKKLISICLQNNLLPSFIQTQFSSIENLLQSGIPTIRNRLGGHGQGQMPQIVDNEITRYALNLTGSNIIFLIKQADLK